MPRCWDSGGRRKKPPLGPRTGEGDGEGCLAQGRSVAVAVKAGGAVAGIGLVDAAPVQMDADREASPRNVDDVLRDPRPKYSICTLVTRPAEYAEMCASFRGH